MRFAKFAGTMDSYNWGYPDGEHDPGLDHMWMIGAIGSEGEVQCSSDEEGTSIMLIVGGLNENSVVAPPSGNISVQTSEVTGWAIDNPTANFTWSE